MIGTIGRDRYRTRLTSRQHAWAADEPGEDGGTDTAPKPSELLLSGLAACQLITARMYADRKGWPLESASIELTMETDKTATPWRTVIRCDLQLEGALDEGQRLRLLDIAGRCPINRMLSGEFEIEEHLVRPI
jgi:putative redox protein